MALRMTPVSFSGEKLAMCLLPTDPAVSRLNLIRHFGGRVGRNQPRCSLDRPLGPIRSGWFVQLDRSTQQIIIDNALIWISGPERFD